jgi:probable HAF family extracellular repeat protein
MRTRAMSASITFAFLLLTAPYRADLAADPGPLLEPLGTLGGPWSTATAINADGVVVGAAPGADHYSRAFVTDAETGTLKDLGTLGGPWSAAYAINAAGMIVGASARTDLRTHAFAFDPDTGVMVDLGTLGGTSSTAYGINRHGTVVGESRDSGGRIRAFVWRAVTGMEALGTLGGISSVAYGVNTDGVVVGESHDVAGHVRAFRTNGDALEDLGTLGGSSSRATAVNDSGQATGSAMTPAGEEHAFRFDPGVGLTDLGTLGGPLSSGEAINAHGHVVGWSLGVDGNIHAFLWTPDSGLVDLNTVAPLPPGTHLVAAYGITDEGQIAGYGVFGGTAMAFRLTVRQAERDVTPPVIHALSATPDRLWPPRHDLVPVTLTVTSTDDSGDPPTCHVVSVSSSEPDASGEADDVPGDVQLVDALSVLLRAERLETGAGRAYTVVVACSDAAGNSAEAATQVHVPKSGGIVKAGGQKGRR